MNVKRLKLIFIDLFWVVIIAFLSYRMPFYTDDYIHRLSFKTGEAITKISQIIPSVREYYNIWGGRAVSMFLIQLMLFLPRWVYAGINGIVFVLMINVEYAYASVWANDPDERTRPVILAAIGFITWFFMPDFLGVLIWTTGTVTYLWMNLIVMYFGLAYYKDHIAAENKDKSASNDRISVGKTVLKCICAIILGLCAGLSDEAAACTLILALVMYVISMFYRKRRITVERWLGIVSCLAGFGLLMLAPGNFARAKEAKDTAEAGVGIITVYLHRIGRETFYTLLFLTIPVAISVVLYLLSCTHKVSPSTVIRDITSGKAPLYMGFAFVSIYVLTFSSGFANRVFQFPLIMLTVCSAVSMQLLFDRAKHAMTGNVYPALSALVVILFVMVIVEVVAGSLYASQAGSFFDRQMMYYHMENWGVEGLLPGNGVAR